MKNKILKICSLIAMVVLSALVGLLAFVDVYGVKVASAEMSAEVLRDLRKDKDFNENDYPYVADDYGLYIIQIAESSNKELFVYAYQPCHDTYDLVGTKISISYGYSLDGSGLTPKLYNLELKSTSGTLDKYYVQGFTVPNDGDRYYNIVEIFRMWKADIDGVQDSASALTDKAYSVGQQWYCCDLNNKKHYEMNTFDTMFVETVFTGNLTVSNGFFLDDLFGMPGCCDIWFYSFNLEDYIATHIFDAILQYSYTIYDFFGAVEKGGEENVTVQLNNNEKKIDEMEISGFGIGAKTFKWHRILSSAEFLSTCKNQKVNIDSDVETKIKSSQWVFSFLETPSGRAFGKEVDYYDVYDVGLLQISFQDISGKKYDLGVVNSLSNPDNAADGVYEWYGAFREFWEKFVKIILIIVGVILLVVLLNFVTPFISVLKLIIKAIVFVISIPFKLLKSIFKKSG